MGEPNLRGTLQQVQDLNVSIDIENYWKTVLYAESADGETSKVSAEDYYKVLGVERNADEQVCPVRLG